MTKMLPFLTVGLHMSQRAVRQELIHVIRIWRRHEGRRIQTAPTLNSNYNLFMKKSLNVNTDDLVQPNLTRVHAFLWHSLVLTFITQYYSRLGKRFVVDGPQHLRKNYNKRSQFASKSNGVKLGLKHVLGRDACWRQRRKL